MEQIKEKFQGCSDANLCVSESPELIFDKLKWLNSKEAALYLRVSVGQIRNMVYRGQLRASYLNNNRLRFYRNDLERCLKPSFLKRKDV